MDPVAEIKARINIVDLLAGRVELKRAGKNFKACCPFHNEKTPSFVISPERGFAWCYGCQTGGDIFKIVQLLEGIEFREALELLAEKAGVELPRTGGGIAREKKDRLLEINAKAAEFFAEKLAESSAAQEYLTKRGISPESVQAWQIGYAPDHRHALSTQLLTAGYDPRELAEAGVSLLRELGGDEVIDRFHDRIMFPIRDAQGRVVAFTGRILGDGEPKYLNSAESPIFTKGSVLFGLDLARTEIREKKVAVLVEGQLDVVSCHQAGFANVVATSGTALTETHLGLLARLTDSVIFAFDGDKAGQDSARRALELAAKADLDSRVVVLPDQYKDPDEAIKADPQIFAQALSAALSPLDFFFQVTYARHDLTETKVKKQVARELLTFAQYFHSALEREEFVKKLALRLQVSEPALLEETKNLRIPKSTKSIDSAVPTPAAFDHEDYLVALVLAFPALAPDLSTLRLHKPENQKIIERLQLHELEISTAIAALDTESEITRAERLRLWAESKCADFGEKALQQEFAVVTSGLTRKDRTSQKRELLTRIAEAEQAGDTALAGELLAEYQQLIAQSA